MNIPSLVVMSVSTTGVNIVLKHLDCQGGRCLLPEPSALAKVYILPLIGNSYFHYLLLRLFVILTNKYGAKYRL